MKHFFSLIILLAFATAGNAAKTFTAFTKSLSQEHKIEASYPITVSHRYGDIEISTWDKQVVKVEAFISGDIKEGEDLEALCNDLMEGLIKVNKDVFIYVPIECYNNNILHLGPKKIKKAELTLTNGNKYAVSELKLKLHIYMPDRHRLAITTRYHDLNMGSYNGDLAVSCDNGSFKAQELRGETRVSMKYGAVNIAKATRLAVSGYDGYMKIGEVDYLDFSSKYSTVSLGSCNEANISSYDDDITAADIGKLSFSSKYTSFSGGNIDDLKADIYDGQFKMGNAANVLISAKYADIVLGAVGSLRMPDSYDNHVSVELADQLLLNSSKYSSYRIGVISGSLTMDGYDDDFKVAHITSTVKDINMRIKYGDYDLVIDKNYSHNIRVASNSGGIDYPKSHYTITSQKSSGSSNTLEATTTGYDGNNRVVIDAYSCNIDLDLK